MVGAVASRNRCLSCAQRSTDESFERRRRGRFHERALFIRQRGFMAHDPSDEIRRVETQHVPHDLIANVSADRRHRVCVASFDALDVPFRSDTRILPVALEDGQVSRTRLVAARFAPRSRNDRITHKLAH